MIVPNLEKAREYLPSLNVAVGNDRLKDFFRRAQEWVAEKIIGPDIEETLEIGIEEGQTDPHGRLRMMASRVICDTAYLAAIAELDVQLSEAGFVVQRNDYVTPASKERTDRLVASLTERQRWGCDGLVRFLAKNSTAGKAYDDWRGSEQFSFLTQAFMPTMEDAMRSTLPADTAWPGFCDRLPEMAQLLRSVAAPYVSEAEIDRLLELYRDGETLGVHNRAIDHLRRVAVKELMDDHAGAVHAAIQARRVMLVSIGQFPEFAHSDQRTLDTVDFGNGPSMNCL